MPTFVTLAGGHLPTDRVYDGVDLTPLLVGAATHPSVQRDASFPRGSTGKWAPGGHTWLFHPDVMTGNVTAVRYQNYKAFFETAPQPGCAIKASPRLYHNPPLIFDLDADPSESTPLSPPPAGLVESFQAAFAAMWANITSTYRSTANYSEGGESAWACCDPSHVYCRCAAGPVL